MLPTHILLFIIFVLISACGGKSIEHSQASSTANSNPQHIFFDRNAVSLNTLEGQYSDDVIVSVTFDGDNLTFGMPPGQAQPVWLDIDHRSVFANEKKATFRIRATNFVSAGNYSAVIRFVTTGTSNAQSLTKDLPVQLSVVRSNASSSASQQSSANDSNQYQVSGEIFSDSLDSNWRGLGAYEFPNDGSPGMDLLNSVETQLIHWDVIESNDSKHNQIIDVTFANNPNVWGVFEILGFENHPTDLSAFATGKLKFDIKLLDAGLEGPPLNLRVDCNYPCESHEHRLNIPTLNEWYSQEINASELIEEGLDISKVRITFSITPAIPHQQGVKFQLDNLRWEKGSTQAPMQKNICYKNSFDSNGWVDFIYGGIPTFYHLEVLQGSGELLNGALWHQIVSFIPIRPNWQTDTDKIGFAPGLPYGYESCLFRSGYLLSAQVYLPKSYFEDGRLGVGLYYQDFGGRRAYFASVNALSLKPDDWTTISTSLSPYDSEGNLPFETIENGFDASAVHYIGVYFNANGKPASVGESESDSLAVDNFAITEQ